MPEKEYANFGDFRGIDKQTHSTKLKNKLYECQNAYPKVLGALSKKSGSELLAENSTYGIDKIIAIHPFYRQQWDNVILGYCHMSSITTPAVGPTLTQLTSSYAFLTSGTTYYVGYSWVGCGGETAVSPRTSITMSANDSITVTLPTFPTGARAANIYISMDATTAHLHLIGTTKATTYNIHTVMKLAAGAMANPLAAPSWPAANNENYPTAGSGGSLEGGRTYYIAFCGIKDKDNAGAFTHGFSYVSTIIPIAVPNDDSDIEGILTVAADTEVQACAIFIGTQYDHLYLYSIEPTANTDGTMYCDFTISSLPTERNISFVKKKITATGEFENIYMWGGNTAAATQQVTIPNYPTANTTGKASLCAFNSSTGAFIREIFRPNNSYLACDLIGFINVSSYYNNTSQLLSYLTAKTKCEFTTLLDRCFFTDGYSPIMKTDAYFYRGIGKGHGEDDLVIVSDHVHSYNNSLIVGGGRSGDNFYYASVPGNPDIFTRDIDAVQVNAILVGTAKGDALNGFGTATAAGREEGSGISLIIGKENSIHFQSIIPLFPGMGSPKNIVYSQDGLVSPKGIVATDFGTFFVGKRNVYFVSADGNIVPIGNPISKIIERIPDADKRLTTLNYHKGFLKLSFKNQNEKIFTQNYNQFVFDMDVGNWTADTIYFKLEAIDKETSHVVEVTDEFGVDVESLHKLVAILPDKDQYYYNIYAGTVSGTLYKANTSSLVSSDTLTFLSVADIPTSGSTPGTAEYGLDSELWCDTRQLINNQRSFDWYGTHIGVRHVSPIVLDGYGDNMERIAVYPYKAKLIRMNKEAEGETSGLFTDLDKNIAIKIKTGDESIGTIANRKRIWDIILKAISETTTDIVLTVYFNKDGNIRSTAIIINIPDGAYTWDEDVWLGNKLAGSGDLKALKAFFGSEAILFDSISLEINETSSSDILITDFGFHYSVEERDI